MTDSSNLFYIISKRFNHVDTSLLPLTYLENAGRIAQSDTSSSPKKSVFDFCYYTMSAADTLHKNYVDIFNSAPTEALAMWERSFNWSVY